MTDEAHHHPKERNLPITQPSTSTVLPRIEIDEADYMHHFENDTYTEEEAHAFLHALWNIMQNCVDVGWGLDNVQIAIDENAQDLTIAFTSTNTLSDTPAKKGD